MLSQSPAASATLETVPTANLSDEQLEFVARLKRLYKADQQAEYLYLQAEVDSLMIKLAQAKADQAAAATV